jgi:aminoglycoside/choline kinase family phosphotransferase
MYKVCLSNATEDLDLQHTPSLSAADSTPADPRLTALRQWVSEVLKDQDFAISVASADASFRRYFRVEHRERTWIAMDAPPEKEDLHPYIRVAQMLAPLGVNAPRILAQDLEQGFLLITDLGGRTYLAELEEVPGQGERLYADALTTLVHMQSRAIADAIALPAYDRPLLGRELSLFPEWFIARHLQITLADAETAQLENVFEILISQALRQPKVFVHRDYHSRNLMVCDETAQGPNPGVLDFQDAVFGPVTYDLVSLLRDCYIEWPPERVAQWVASFREQAARVGLDVGGSEAQFQRWFDLMGLQRHLKAIGIFARLWHRDGKPGYLKDIPRTLGYVRAVSANYPQLHAFSQFIDERVLPALNLKPGTP